MKGNIAMVVGGAGGVGASLTLELLKSGYKKVYVVDRNEPNYDTTNVEFIKFNLVSDNIDTLKQYNNIEIRKIPIYIYSRMC